MPTWRYTTGSVNCKYSQSKRKNFADLFIVRPNGVRFIASPGTSEFVRRWDPKPGDIVSFKHHGFLEATQKPKLPTVYRMRTDMTWQDVINNWKEQKANTTGITFSTCVCGVLS